MKKCLCKVEGSGLLNTGYGNRFFHFLPTLDEHMRKSHWSTCSILDSLLFITNVMMIFPMSQSLLTLVQLLEQFCCQTQGFLYIYPHIYLLNTMLPC